MVIVEPNSCFLQMRKLRARDWPEFVELIGGTPRDSWLQVQLPGLPNYTPVISVSLEQLCAVGLSAGWKCSVCPGW